MSKKACGEDFSHIYLATQIIVYSNGMNWDYEQLSFALQICQSSWPQDQLHIFSLFFRIIQIYVQKSLKFDKKRKTAQNIRLGSYHFLYV